MSYKANARYARYRTKHREKLNRLSREWRAKNPERVRASNLKHSFGLTVDEYDRLLEVQGGLCAICGKKCSTGKRLSVDHDHDTGRVRGLLCMKCNLIIGHANDSVTLLRAVILYLTR